jgi:hypothetical protein
MGSDIYYYFFKVQIPIRAGLMIRLLNVILCWDMFTAYITMCFSFITNSWIIFSVNSSSKIILQLNFISCLLWCLSICVKPLGVTWNGGNKESKFPPIFVTIKNFFCLISWLRTNEKLLWEWGKEVYVYYGRYQTNPLILSNSTLRLEC